MYIDLDNNLLTDKLTMQFWNTKGRPLMEHWHTKGRPLMEHSPTGCHKARLLPE